jgi:hypothetical protein
MGAGDESPTSDGRARWRTYNRAKYFLTTTCNNTIYHLLVICRNVLSFHCSKKMRDTPQPHPPFETWRLRINLFLVLRRAR